MGIGDWGLGIGDWGLGPQTGQAGFAYAANVIANGSVQFLTLAMDG